MEADFYNYLVEKDYEGFFRYGFYRRIMKFYFGPELSEYKCRKVFNNMVNSNLFYRIDPYGRRCYLYKLKVETPQTQKKIGLVVFD
jgi:hypothetical protein